MHSFLMRNMRALPLAALAVGVAVLIWATRDAPLLLGPLVRIDGLGLFFMVAALGAAARTAQGWGWRACTLSLLWSAFTLATSATPLIALGFIVLAVLATPRGRLWPTRSPRTAMWQTAGELVWAAPLPLAAACVAVGYGMLALRGAGAYDDRLAGAALDSIVFWFVLLGAVLPLAVFGRAQRAAPGAHQLALLWLYPLVRLYSLGPWNSGWGLATLLFGGAAALWLAVGALRTRCTGSARAVMLALALACFGLGTSAGIAAGCYAVLVGAVLGEPPIAPGDQGQEARWFERSVGQFVAPFVVIWLVIGAAIAGGSVALAGVAWLAALLGGLALVLATQRVRSREVGASLALGGGAPVLIGLLIMPAVAQLQGGLSAYGDLLIWPWVGLAVVNSAQTQVAVLPSLAVALLMLVLAALLSLLKLLVVPAPAEAGDAPGEPIAPATLFDALRHAVPWLGSRRSQEQPVDPE